MTVLLTYLIVTTLPLLGLFALAAFIVWRTGKTEGLKDLAVLVRAWRWRR